jgi:gluconate:H+ symporter, GntP family
MQPILATVGLATDSGRALAALAVGAGAMTAPHMNDEFFWLVCGSADLRPGRGLMVLSAGALVQGLIAIAALLAIAALVWVG